MTDQELVAYYVNLLVIQYKTLPNAQGTIAALASEAVASQIYSQVLNGFNVQTAIGKQLDLIGEYVGAQRVVPDFTPAAIYFAFPPYAGPTPPDVGFALYADTTDPPDLWREYTTTDTAYTLTDGQMRALIQYLIAVHNSDHTLNSIDLILQQFFGNYVLLIDNENMTITYQHDSADPNLLFSIIDFLGFLPHPAGVGIIVTTI